jgi:hypothetical protein
MDEEDSTSVAEPNSITTMKRFYGDRLAILSEEDLMAEMVGGNDRSTIITVASYADGAVESKLAECLPGLKGFDEKQYNIAVRSEGPIGTFSARIDMLFYLAVIDERMRGQLHDLRHMRNAVAHTRRRVTFADKALQNVAKRLFSPAGNFPLHSHSPDGYRKTFVAEGNLIGACVTFGREEALRLTRESFARAGRSPPF